MEKARLEQAQADLEREGYMDAVIEGGFGEKVAKSISEGNYDDAAEEIVKDYVEAKTAEKVIILAAGNWAKAWQLLKGVWKASKIRKLKKALQSKIAKRLDKISEQLSGLSKSKGTVVVSSTRGPLDIATIRKVRAIEKGKRPLPSTYMSKIEIDNHLKKFDKGASRFMTKSNFDKYGPGQIDGTSFVMTKEEADQLLASTGGDKRALERALGLPENQLDSSTLVRVDIDNPRELNVRVPSGNEAGANSDWIPGGRLPSGKLEAVVDIKGAPPGSYKAVPIDF